MARKRKNEGLAEILIVLPWWVGVGLGIVGFIAVRWIIPSMLPPIFKSAVPSIHFLAWFPLGLFSLLGLISLARSKMNDSDVASSRGRRAAGRASSHHRESTTEPGSSTSSNLGGGWGRSASHVEPTAKVDTVDTWTVDGLRKLEWKRFELLCAEYYEAVGFKSETIRCGADGGIDIKLFKIDPNKPLAIAQCKAWNSGPVGVKEVRELLGVMAHEKIARGVFITTGSYTKDALSFGAASPIQLLDGEGFIKKILELAKDKQDELLSFAFGGDYTTPTCASCGIKMARREGKKGAFWGCLNYPKCRSTFVFKN